MSEIMVMLISVHGEVEVEVVISGATATHRLSCNTLSRINSWVGVQWYERKGTFHDYTILEHIRNCRKNYHIIKMKEFFQISATA